MITIAIFFYISGIGIIAATWNNWISKYLNSNLSKYPRGISDSSLFDKYPMYSFWSVTSALDVRDKLTINLFKVSVIFFHLTVRVVVFNQQVISS